jgi:glyoxylase-like metal-dependent hydrolase (beta-lactamase superfamily II)
MSAIKGSLVVSDRAGIRIHSYGAPTDGWLVNSHIVEGPMRLILFDGQLISAYAEEVAGYAAGLGKPVDRIIISHGHPDHWAGLEALVRHFPQVPIHALAGVAETIRHAGPTMIAGLQRLLGDRVASTVTLPTHVLEPGPTVIDGIAFDFREVTDAESDRQLVASLPEQRAILAFDLVFSARDHLFTTLPHFDDWIGLLEALKAQQGYDLLLVGHGAPVDFGAIDATIAYLRRAAEIHSRSVSGADYAAALKTAFPERAQCAWADFSGRRLFASPQP